VGNGPGQLKEQIVEMMRENLRGMIRNKRAIFPFRYPSENLPSQPYALSSFFQSMSC